MLFVTGLTGLVGQALQRVASDEGVALRGLSRRDGRTARGTAGNPSAPLEWVEGDLADTDRLAAALKDTRAVLHMAAQTGAASDAVFHEANVRGTQHLVAAAERAGVRRFVFVSSIAVTFGNVAEYAYARTKRDAEVVVSESDLDWVIVRPTLVLAPGAPNLVKLASLAGLPLVPRLGGGRVRLQPVDARDLASLLLDLSEQGPSRVVLEVGGPETLTMGEFLEQIRSARGLGSAPSLPVPLFPVRLAVKALGAILGDRAPIKAAQLSSFTEDAVAAPHPFVRERASAFHSLSETLRECLSP